MKFTLLYDPAHAEELHVIYAALGDSVVAKFPVGKETPVEQGGTYLLHLSDQQIRNLLPKFNEQEARIAALPHPEATQVCAGWGIHPSLEKALAHVKTHVESIQIDVLYCNGVPVFNNIIVGYTFRLASNDSVTQPKSAWEHAKLAASRFWKLVPFMVEIQRTNGQNLKTALSGIVIVQHGKSTLLSRLILEDSFVNDGMFHAFLISPRSVSELLTFAPYAWQKAKHLPPFAGHIKGSELVIFSRKGIDFTLDNLSLSAQKMELSIAKKYLSIFPGRYLKTADASTSGEIYKVQSLPTGEAAQELVVSRLPILKHATTEEFKELFRILRENARTKNSYLVLMVLSTLLASFGLFANSSPVVIGAMILAPLMAPIISLSMGTLRQDKKLALESSYTILAGLGLALACAMLITLITPINLPNSEILARTRPNLLDLGIAIVSGIAGAYAHAREEVAKTLAGVAIAVALVPPLAVSGIGLAWFDWEIFFGAGLLLLTNLAGIVLAAAVTFLFLGFSPSRMVTKGIGISLVLVLLLSIPLAVGFQRMVYEHRTIQRMNNWQLERVELKEVRVQRFEPLTISFKLVTEQPLSAAEIDHVKQQIEERLGQPVRLEITIAFLR